MDKKNLNFVIHLHNNNNDYVFKYHPLFIDYKTSLLTAVLCRRFIIHYNAFYLYLGTLRTRIGMATSVKRVIIVLYTAVNRLTSLF